MKFHLRFHLDLRHARRATTTATSAAAHARRRRARHEHRHHDRSHVSGPGEPQEGNGGLSLATALGHIVGAVGDFVALEVRLGGSVLGVMIDESGTYLVVARVTLELCGEGDRGAEEEDGVQGVQNDHDDWVAGPVDVEGCRDGIEQREHGEDRAEHRVVHCRWVAGEGIGDHVSDQGHDEERPEELELLVCDASRGSLHVPPRRGGPIAQLSNSWWCRDRMCLSLQWEGWEL